MTTDELDERLRVAREYKRANYGADLTSEVYGEIDTTAPRKPGRPAQWTPEKRRESALKHRQATARRLMAKREGTFGIDEVPKLQSKRMKFRAFTEKITVFDCAIDAMEARNAYVRRKYPGVDEFVIHAGDVWRKWGCICGKHEGGNDASE